MNSGMQLYYDYTVSPLGKLFYTTVWEQLSTIKNKKVLDFGSGFGFTSNFLAKNNSVTAIEKDPQMIEASFREVPYEQINGDLSTLQSLEENSFDVVVCHLVLEFVDNASEILNACLRVLKKGGTLSIVRHNKYGRIIQAIVQDYDLKEVENLLDGGYSYSSAFGDIKYYENEDLINWANDSVSVDKVHGVRALASLQSAAIQNKDNWLTEMQAIEWNLLQDENIIKIAYFNHVLFTKI